jgi:hypothetical protein
VVNSPFVSDAEQDLFTLDETALQIPKEGIDEGIQTSRWCQGNQEHHRQLNVQVQAGGIVSPIDLGQAAFMPHHWLGREDLVLCLMRRWGRNFQRDHVFEKRTKREEFEISTTFH